ncbi:MAG: restriction endonuclease [Flexibacteraceae bacterium]
MIKLPTYQELLKPVLEELNAVFPEGLRKVPLSERIANNLNIPFELRNQKYDSGRGIVFDERVGWAVTYLVKAGLIDKAARGLNKITDEGKNLLLNQDGPYDNNTLRRYPSFIEYLSPRIGENTDLNSEQPMVRFQTNHEPPLEFITSQYAIIKAELANEIIDYILNQSPTFFEKLIIELLTKIGYGGNFKDSSQHSGQPGDEGIDGIINEDRLGLGKIYLQAKRYRRDIPVGRPAIQSFAGALSGRGAITKGVFITTSKFTSEAKSFISHTSNIVLIDGNQLAELMMEYGLGVSTQQTFVIQKIDTDYFED